MDNLEKLQELTEKLGNIEFDLFTFFNEIPILFCIAEKTGNFTKINPAWTNLLGWSSEELTSKPWVYFVHPDDVQKTIKASEILEGVPLLGFENRYKIKSGGYATIKWYVSNWINGKNYGIAIHVKDETTD